jgi:hypothetical protein
MTAAQPKQAAPLPNRMRLDALVKGKQQAPIRVLLFGVEGIGKSTFGADAPSPIFLGAEDGTSQLDVTRFPQPSAWTDVLDAVRTLQNEEHSFKTLVLDTVDWAEPMLWSHICKRDGQESIEAYGYGKGYQAALDEWRIFLAALERLRAAKGMHVLLLAHSAIRPFKNPEGEDFDRYELKLNAKAGGLLKEWCDAVLFANFETFASKDSKTKRVRGVSTGARLIYTERRAAYDAKNRYGLPDQLPLSWADFFAAVQSGQPADPGTLIAEIERKAKQVGGDLEKKAAEGLKRAGTDATKLAQLNNWMSAKLAEKEQAQ